MYRQWNKSIDIQWNLRNKTTIRAMKSGRIFEVVLILRAIIHIYMDLGLNQSGLIFKVVVSGVPLYIAHHHQKQPAYTVVLIHYQHLAM